ncbi:DUF2955 domain-containing protein [Echinimonas agarilytica]|uniref:DUF2955 domain-containing protein n=1 Tax=Echinimonas agarilytica TaxID=1215918 RepID=A0AA41W3C0_9GAMM|nr:DUF2955 domain-containing protein [Echinimonas agarilytica]MCM2678094.1 DUF2955 domain-containing protein [Echinimonas agarilytica]
MTQEELLKARTFRFTFGLVASTFVGLTVDFALGHLIFVLVAKFLTIPAAPSTKGTFVLFLCLVVMPAIFNQFVSAFGFQPGVMIPLLCLLLFWFYYLGTEPKFILIATFGIIFLVLISFMGVLNGVVVSEITTALMKSSSIAIAIYLVSHALFPEPHTERNLPTSPYSSFVRVLIAAKSVIVLLPILLYFLFTMPTNIISVLIFSALFLMQVSVAEQIHALKLFLIINILSAILAVATFELFTMIPSLVYCLLFMATIGIYFGREIFSGSKVGKLYAGAITGYLVLFGGLATGTSDDIGAKSTDRLMQIIMTCAYIATVAHVIEIWLFKRWKVKFKDQIEAG